MNHELYFNQNVEQKTFFYFEILVLILDTFDKISGQLPTKLRKMYLALVPTGMWFL